MRSLVRRCECGVVERSDSHRAVGVSIAPWVSNTGAEFSNTGAAVVFNTAPTANRASVIGGLEGRRLCGPASSEGFKTSLLIALSHRAHMYGLLDGRFLGGMLLGGPFKVYAGL